MSETVKIVNPLPGGGCYTSRPRADSFVRRGSTIYTPAGELYFVMRGNRIVELHERKADRGEKNLFPWTGAKRGNRFSERESTPGIFRS